LVIYDSGQNSDVIIEKLTVEVHKICDWCTKNGLSINFDKTKYMVFHKDKDVSIKDEVNNGIKINNYSIDRVYSFKYLGIIFEPTMRFNAHFLSVKTKISHRLKYLYGIKRYLPSKTMVIMLNAYVNSVVDYGLDIWAVQTSTKLNELQEKVNRFLISYFLPGLIRRSKRSKEAYLRVRNSLNVKLLWKRCNFLSIRERKDYVILKNTFLDSIDNTLVFSQRSIDKNMPYMTLPKFNSELFKNSVIYKGIILWNTLPKEWLYKSMTYCKFKNLVKEWIVSKVWDVFV